MSSIINQEEQQINQNIYIINNYSSSYNKNIWDTYQYIIEHQQYNNNLQRCKSPLKNIIYDIDDDN